MTNNKAQQSAEKTAEQQQVLRDLLALGKKNGRLTLKEMADALSHLELESDDIDKLYETLESMGVEVETEGVLEKALGDGDDDSFEPGTVEEVPEEELIDTSAMAETFAIDDPVRMYLKEIGKVDLLTPEEEEPSYSGRVNLIDLESADLSDERNMKLRITGSMHSAYNEAMADLKAEIKEFCVSRGAEFVSVRSDRPIEKMLFGELLKVGIMG